MLFVACCWLCVVRCLLLCRCALSSFVGCCVLCVVCCLLFTVCRLLFVVCFVVAHHRLLLVRSFLVSGKSRLGCWCLVC